MFTSFWLFTLVVFAMKGKIDAAGEYNCVDIRFLNHDDEVIYCNVNDYINITFAIDWVNCSLSTSERLIKVVAKTTEYPTDECKVMLIKGTCSVSDNTPCFCMTAAGPITFYKRITKPVNVTYVWLWYHGDQAQEKSVTVQILDVPLEVTTCCAPEDDLPRPGVVISIIGFLCRLKVNS